MSIVFFWLLFGDTSWVYFLLSFNLLGKLCFAFAQPPPYPITFLMVQLLHKWITYLRQPRSNEQVLLRILIGLFLPTSTRSDREIEVK